MNDLGRKIWVFPDAFLPLEGEVYKTTNSGNQYSHESLCIVNSSSLIANLSIDFLYEDDDPIHKGKDGVHEDLGANYLEKYFGEDVTLPIRAHVASKRYLAAVEDGYYDDLSEASKKSLKVQGGIFSKEEAEEFINKPQMKEAVEMRRFDDQAKILNKTTPSVEHFRKYVENSFQANSN